MEFSEIYELNRLSGRSLISLSPKILHELSNSSQDFDETENLPCSDKEFFINPKAENTTRIKIEKDESYINETSKGRRSSLVLSLLNLEDPDELNEVNQLLIEVYYFRSLVKLFVKVPLEITVFDMIGKALQALNKKNILELPFGLDSNGYQF